MQVQFHSVKDLNKIFMKLQKTVGFEDIFISNFSRNEATISWISVGEGSAHFGSDFFHALLVPLGYTVVQESPKKWIVQPQQDNASLSLEDEPLLPPLVARQLHQCFH